MTVPNVRVTFGTPTAGGTASFPIQSRVFDIAIDRGRDRALDPPAAGICELMLRNQDGFWNVGNSGGTVAALSGTAVRTPPETLLAPYTPVQVQALSGTAVIATLFTGRIRQVDYSYEPGGESSVRVLAEDGYADLSRQTFDGYAAPELNAGSAVAAVLTQAGWPAIYAGTAGSATTALSTATTATIAANQSEDGVNVAEYLARIQATEQAPMFVSRDGQFRFFPRYDPSPPSPPIEFASGTATGGTAFSAIPYQTLIGKSGGDVTYTAVSATNPITGTYQRVTAAGTASYGVQDLQFSDLLAASDEQQLGVLGLVASQYSTPEWRIEQVQVRPMALSDSGGATSPRGRVLNVELGDRVRASYVPAAGSAVAGLFTVQRISHQVTPGDQTMTVTLSRRVAEFSSFFTIGTSTLNGTATLGF